MTDLRDDWNALYSASLADEDIMSISNALSDFFSLLRTWDTNTEEVAKDGKNNRDNISTHGA